MEEGSSSAQDVLQVRTVGAGHLLPPPSSMHATHALAAGATRAEWLQSASPWGPYLHHSVQFHWVWTTLVPLELLRRELAVVWGALPPAPGPRWYNQDRLRATYLC